MNCCLDREQCFVDVVIECPIAKLAPKFPCPGATRHRLNYYEQYETSCWSLKNPLCRIGAFSDLRFTMQKEIPNTCLSVLDKTILSLSYDNVDCILQMGNIIDTRKINTEAEVQDVIAHLAHVFNKTYRTVYHVIGDMDSAVREQYVNSFMRDHAFALERTRNNLKYCGDLFYSVSIGPQWRLVVLDGYEQIMVEPRDTTECRTSYNSERTGDGFVIHINYRDPQNQRCMMHINEATQPVGWPRELKAMGEFLTAEERSQLPRLRLVMTHRQLKWLDEVIQSALSCNENIIAACHAPLHPGLVEDRSMLVSNWRDVLKIFMQHGVVRCCLMGRPLGLDDQGCFGLPNYQMDHGILYFNMPPLMDMEVRNSRVSASLLIDLGRDYVRIRGEKIGLLPEHQQYGLIHSFRPRTKISYLDRDYSFNGAINVHQL